ELPLKIVPFVNDICEAKMEVRVLRSNLMLTPTNAHRDYVEAFVGAFVEKPGQGDRGSPYSATNLKNAFVRLELSDLYQIFNDPSACGAKTAYFSSHTCSSE